MDKEKVGKVELKKCKSGIYFRWEGETKWNFSHIYDDMEMAKEFFKNHPSNKE